MRWSHVLKGSLPQKPADIARALQHAILRLFQHSPENTYATNAQNRRRMGYRGESEFLFNGAICAVYSASRRKLRHNKKVNYASPVPNINVYFFGNCFYFSPILRPGVQQFDNYSRNSCTLRTSESSTLRDINTQQSHFARVRLNLMTRNRLCRWKGCQLWINFMQSFCLFFKIWIYFS